MPLTTKILFAANILGLALFLGMAFLLPLHSESAAQQQFQLLQQQGPVTTANVASIADPAVKGAVTASNVGIGLTLLNVCLFAATNVKKKKKA
jgi:ABC-type phosphate transport system permease subunit